jgi:hypothetical protein
MLVEDVARKVAKTESTKSKVEVLVNEKLLSREYAVICRQTSNQVNRVKSMEVLERMREHEVQCSCGRPIADELVQELYSPSPVLQKLLNQSYWLTARLVSALRRLGVADDRILLNLQEGPEEIDTFVDLEGSLLMFELKDNEFSMGHAYPFAGRIGIYRPDYAIIVSTEGVAPDVKAYMNKISPGAKVRYVESLEQMQQELLRVKEEIYNELALRTLASLDGLALAQIPLTRILSAKIGVKVPSGRSLEDYFLR